MKVHTNGDMYDSEGKYYYALYLAQIANEDKDIEHMNNHTKEYTIEPPKAQIKPKRLFNFKEDFNEQE